MTERIKPTPFDDGTALAGPDAPKDDGQILHLIRYLLTVYKRFGNTAVTTQLQWGSSALWKRDEQAKKIVELEARIAKADDQIVALKKRLAVEMDAYDESYGRIR